VIDRAATLHLIGDQAIALVEEKNAEFLALGQRYGGAAIIENIAERGSCCRLRNVPRTSRRAAASTILTSAMAASPSLSFA
jgi:hypothetical protein